MSTAGHTEAGVSARNDSLRTRYFAKLIANLVGLAISLVTQGVVLRNLSPKSFGDYSYLTNLATQAVTFFDMGTTLGFYTKLSNRQREFSLVAFYFFFSVLLTAVVLTLAWVARFAGLGHVLWPDQPLTLVYFAIVWAVMNWYLQAVNNMGDAYGLTVPIEQARVAQRFLGLGLIYVLALSHRLDITHYFVYTFVINGFLIGGILWILTKAGHFTRVRWRLRRDEVRSYVGEFSSFGRPLVAYFLIASAVAALDRWLLQVFSGSVQQGYFGVSSQIGLVCFLITQSVVTLIMREFAIAYARRDFLKLAGLFRRYVPLFYGISTFLACFIAIEAPSVADLFGGAKFHDAGLVIAIMAMYQIHQTYGVLSSSIFMATGQTALYSTINIGVLLLGIPVAYLLLASRSQFGLHAGAAGLAMKMVAVQFVAVNIQLFYLCRFLRLNFRRYLQHQLGSVVILFALAAAAAALIERVWRPGTALILHFLAAGALYTLLVVGALFVLPPLFGLRRSDLNLRALLLAAR